MHLGAGWAFRNHDPTCQIGTTGQASHEDQLAASVPGRVAVRMVL